jgi:hypothetical protein
MEGFVLHPGRVLSPRYCLLSIFLLLFSINSIQAKTVVIGGGSGFITVPDMTGLNPGDSLAITGGQYTGASFSNLNWITITNNGSPVVFNGKVTLNTLEGCVFSGFQFRNVNGTSIRWLGNSRRCTEKYISFMYCSGITNDANDPIVYNGDTSTLKLYMCTFDSLTLFSSGIVLRGAYGVASDRACYMDSIVLSRIKVDSTLGNGLEVGGVIFRIDAHDWKETYKGVITQGGDCGIFTIYGNGSIHNVYRTGGRGYIARIWDLGLNNVTGNTYFYNNIDLNTYQYGSLDTKIDETQFVQSITGGKCFTFTNTVGNKQDHIGYWSSVAVVGDYPLPWVCQVRNNLGFNLQTNNKPPIAMNQSNGTWKTDSSNNMYFATPDSVIDPVTCIPFPNSPVLGKGLTLNLVQDDYYHNPRIGAYDIGAVQHGGTIIPPPPNLPPVALTGAAQTITLPVSSTSLDGSASYDPDGIIISYAWVLVSGTGGTLASPSSATTPVSGLTPGTYIYKLTVTDNSNASTSALDTIIVNPAPSQPPPNIPPVANAGSGQTITAPSSSVILDGSASFDPDGSIVSYSWVLISGQGSVVISNSNKVVAGVSGLTPGSYTFQLTVTDNSGATNSDQVTVTVNAALNKIVQPPVAIAGSDTTIYLPVSSFLLNASNSYDPDGNIISYQWQEISGPNTAIASTMNSPQVDVSNLQQGIYQFLLTVTDNQGASSTATVKISVDKNSGSPDQFTVFPNPAQDILNSRINSPVNGTIRMVVYDMNGRQVMTDEAEKSVDLYEKSLNVSGLSSGMYLIQVNIANMKFLVTKFIKK